MLRQHNELPVLQVAGSELSAFTMKNEDVSSILVLDDVGPAEAGGQTIKFTERLLEFNTQVPGCRLELWLYSSGEPPLKSSKSRLF